MLARFALPPVPFTCFVIAVAAIATAFFPSSAFTGRADANLLLARADEIRVPAQSFRMKVKVDGASQPMELVKKKNEPSLFLANAAFFTNGSSMTEPETSLAPWAADYKARFERADRKETQILLVAKKPETTHQRIRLWVDSKSVRPLRAEWLGKDGRSLVRRAYYEDYKDFGGRQRPGRIRLEDDDGHSSQLAILAIETLKPDQL